MTSIDFLLGTGLDDKEIFSKGIDDPLGMVMEVMGDEECANWRIFLGGIDEQGMLQPR